MARQLKNVFITYPRTKLPKEVFGDLLHTVFKCVYTMCVQETHAEDNENWETDKHLHALLVLPRTIKKKVLLHFFTRAYPNDYKRIRVEGCRNVKYTIETYFTKEDQDPWTKGTRPIINRPRPDWLPTPEAALAIQEHLYAEHLITLEQIYLRERDDAQPS